MGYGAIIIGDEIIRGKRQDKHFATAIEALAGSTLARFELRKLRFPKPQDVGFDFADAGDVTDFEVETVGDRGRLIGALMGELRGHGDL